MSWRHGLLVLWRRDPRPELRVCNAFTGGVTSLPLMDVEGKWGSGGIYRPALLNLGRGGRSFELLVMDVCLRTRIFSSRTGWWGSIRVVKPPPEHGSWCVIDEAMPTSPAVVRRTVHWICRSARGAGGVFVLALRVGAAQATAIPPPPPARLGGTASCTLTDAAATLRMVVSETEAVSMWRLSAEGWSQEAVISKQGIAKQVAAGMDARRTACWCVGFSERSGAVTFWMERVGLVHLDLGTMEVVVVLRWCREDDGTRAVAPVRLQEIDLAALFQVN